MKNLDDNIYQNATNIRKVLLGVANEIEKKQLEDALLKNPPLKREYELLKNNKNLQHSFKNYRLKLFKVV